MKIEALRRRHSATCCIAEEIISLAEARELIQFHSKYFPLGVEKFVNEDHTTWFIDNYSETVTVSLFK